MTSRNIRTFNNLSTAFICGRRVHERNLETEKDAAMTRRPTRNFSASSSSVASKQSVWRGFSTPTCFV